VNIKSNFLLKCFITIILSTIRPALTMHKTCIPHNTNPKEMSLVIAYTQDSHLKEPLILMKILKLPHESQECLIVPSRQDFTEEIYPHNNYFSGKITISKHEITTTFFFTKIRHFNLWKQIQGKYTWVPVTEILKCDTFDKSSQILDINQKSIKVSWHFCLCLQYSGIICNLHDIAEGNIPSNLESIPKTNLRSTNQPQKINCFIYTKRGKILLTKTSGPSLNAEAYWRTFTFNFPPFQHTCLQHLYSEVNKIYPDLINTNNTKLKHTCISSYDMNQARMVHFFEYNEEKPGYNREQTTLSFFSDKFDKSEAYKEIEYQWVSAEKLVAATKEIINKYDETLKLLAPFREYTLKNPSVRGELQKIADLAKQN